MGPGGGVGVLLRKGFTVKQITTSSFKSMEYMDLSVTTSNSSLRLLTIYRPPPSKKNKTTHNMFLNEFSVLLKDLAVVTGNLIITGDFNFHFENANNREAARFMDLLQSAGFEQKVIGATHKRRHTLDLVIVRNSDSSLKGEPEIIHHSYTISDHSAILCTVDMPRICTTKMTVHRRNLRRIDMESWRNDIRDSVLHSAASDSSSDVNILTEEYNNVLRQLIDKHAPMRSRSITLRPHTPWFNDHLRCLKRQKRQLERRSVTSGLEIHRQMYREHCRLYTDAIKSAKMNYYKAKISESDQRQLFSLIDALFKVKTVPPLTSHESTKRLAEDFTDFFANKIQDLKDNLHSSTLLSMELSVETSQLPCKSTILEFSKVSENFIRDIAEKSKSKSCVQDLVPTNVLKQSIDVLAAPLTAIINASLTSGVFPASLKKAVIHPSIKKPSLDREQLLNYCSITNIAFLSKTLERVAAKQTLNYLTSNGLLSTFQSAYRCFHSTETALIRVFNDILVALDNHQEVVLVLLDLSAAFDTIDHSALLSRLQCRYGINGTVLKWFQSYLYNRTQQVIIIDSLSSEKKLLSGVPQGSVLGPILFSLFFGPLEDVILAHGLKVMVYADDTQLYISIGSYKDRPVALAKLELCIKDILVWCISNGLACNPGKTEIVHFLSRFSSSSTMRGININGISISPSSDARNLGVTVDSHLQMTKHVNNICKSAFLAIRNIGRIRKYLDRENCERLVHAFVTSKLDSCNSLLVGLPNSEIEKLQRVQNSAARLIMGTKRGEHITPVLYHLHWLPITCRIDFKILLMTYKALNC